LIEEALPTTKWANLFISITTYLRLLQQVLDGALPPTADPFTSTTFIKVAIDQFGQAPIFTVQTFEGANVC